MAGLRVKLHAFLTSVFMGGKWSASQFCVLYIGKSTWGRLAILFTGMLVVITFTGLLVSCLTYSSTLKMEAIYKSVDTSRLHGATTEDSTLLFLI
jgi:hypothetical protein